MNAYHNGQTNIDQVDFYLGRQNKCDKSSETTVTLNKIMRNVANTEALEDLLNLSQLKRD